MNLSILYRGALSSCNYGCEYCPFAKHTESREKLARDRADLARFVAWVTQRPETIGVLFTPWGEALTRRWYQNALADLTHSPNVVKAAIQTNLSAKLDWLAACDRSKLGLWCTYHPGETTRAAFLAQCRILMDHDVRFSVGVVGLKEHQDEIAVLRSELPPNIYLWVNAYKREPDYYTSDMVEHLTSIDELFPINNTYHASRGERCRTGQSVVSVDGFGDVRRCHFVKDVIGNLYDGSFNGCLQERVCPNTACGCHIGYVHLERLGLDHVFGDGILERVLQPRKGTDFAVYSDRRDDS